MRSGIEVVFRPFLVDTSINLKNIRFISLLSKAGVYRATPAMTRHHGVHTAF